jgi:metallo-beta-lactamase class B
MKRLTYGCAAAICALFLASSISAFAQQPEGARNGSDAEIESWYEPAEPITIVGPIHFVGTRGLAAYLITTPAGHILLNGAMPQSAALIEANIRKLGYDPADIEILLAGHAHIDHVGTHAYFEKLSGARVMMMGAEKDLLESGGRSDFNYAHVDRLHFESVQVDHVLKDGETIALGGVTMTARLTPGHTRGSTTWLMNVEEDGKTYHVVFPEGMSINPGYRVARYPSYPGIADAYEKTFKILDSLDADIMLPSHTSFFDFETRRARAEEEHDEDAWVDPGAYHALIADRKRTYKKWVEHELQEPTFAGASWRLVGFRGARGESLVPPASSTYAVVFADDGSVAVQNDCHHSNGTWQLDGWNEIELGELEGNGDSCAAPLTDRLAADWSRLGSYQFKDGRLLLTIGGDGGGVYEFEREGAATAAEPTRVRERERPPAGVVPTPEPAPGRNRARDRERERERERDDDPLD